MRRCISAWPIRSRWLWLTRQVSPRLILRCSSSLLYFWRALGTSELWLRLPSVLAGTVFCWIFYKWLSKAAGNLAGLIGLLFVALLSSHRPDSRQRCGSTLCCSHSWPAPCTFWMKPSRKTLPHGWPPFPCAFTSPCCFTIRRSCSPPHSVFMLCSESSRNARPPAWWQPGQSDNSAAWLSRCSCIGPICRSWAWATPERRCKAG